MKEPTDFLKVDKPSTLIPILEKRLPGSTSILNMVLLHEKYGDKNIEYYKLGSGENEEDTWILIKWKRDDYKFWIWASAPNHSPENGAGAELLRATLKNNSGEEKIMDWSVPSLLWVDKACANGFLSAYTAKVETRVLRLECWREFCMSAEDALNKLEVSTGRAAEKNVRVGPLEESSGVPFIAKYWYLNHVSTPENLGKVIKKSIARGASGGVYVKEESSNEERLVCAAVVEAGQIGMLNTDPAYRKKGYARLCITYMLREMAKEGLIPCIAGDVTNPAAINLYKGISGLEMVEDNFVHIFVGGGDW